MQDQINLFLDKKGINNTFIRSIVSDFITKHTLLYGDIVPYEDLINRLENNLNTINLINPSEAPQDFSSVVGRYEGFDKGSICMYFRESDLLNPKLKEHFVEVLLHELTHCAYTIKQNDIFKSEMQVFGTYEKLVNGTTPLIKGDNTYMEPIINYISSRIYGQKSGAYLAQTSNIKRLSQIIGEKNLVSSAFTSNEEQFRKSFENLPEGAYEYFTSGMKWFNFGRQFGFKKGNDIMDNFFSGNIPNISKKQQIAELKSLKGELKSLVQNQEIQQSVSKSRTRGFMDVCLLFTIVSVFCLSWLGLLLMLLK